MKKKIHLKDEKEISVQYNDSYESPMNVVDKAVIYDSGNINEL